MRSSYGAQQQHMTVPTNSLTLSKARPPLGHGARPLRQLSLCPPALASPRCTTARAASLSLHFAPLSVPQTRHRYPFSSSHNRTRTRDAFPQSPPPAFPSSLSNHFSSNPPSPDFHHRGFTPSPQPLFSNRPSSNLHPAFPAPTTSPRTALQQFPPQGLTLFSLNHFFSNTIATDRLPLPDGPFVATETRRQQLWLGCA